MNDDLPLQRTAARHALRMCMEFISEDRWCAGWHIGLECMLWRDVHDWRANPALSSEDEAFPDSARAVARTLSWLAEQADGWWIWPREGDGPRVVSMSEWRAICDLHCGAIGYPCCKS
ncbi:MAG: hypothetical protein HY778_11530 [Betaproteobacteria bacterium]|nr:hypothetical protein [Betaproteobacteria bacterium]